MRGFEIDDARQEDPLHPFFHKVEDMAVTHLDGETGFRDDILHSLSDQLFVGRVGKDDPITQLRRRRPSRRETSRGNRESCGIPISGASGGSFFFPS